VLHRGHIFEGYVLDETLGRGGSATVYRVHEKSEPQRALALKILPEDHCGEAELARLDREFEFAQRLDHPHVVKVFRHGPGWVTMQFIDGGTVSSLHALNLRLTALAQIAGALDYVHRMGIVHLDVKPANILVSHNFSDAGAILIDFGVARSLAADVGHRPTHIQASLPYTAPEILRGQTPWAPADEYALACTAVELITGAPPFTANTSVALVDAHVNSSPPRVSHKITWVPRAFDSILAKAMAKNPDDRYESCTEFVRLITRTLR
jgi:serine/threonine protein kinase